MAQQYIDYASEFTARQEREKQLARQYSQKPKPVKQQGLWMHSIERHESPNELLYLAVTFVLLVCAGLAVGFYFAS